MKQEMTLQELAAEVQRVKASKRDFLGETKYLEARPRLEIVTSGPVASLEHRRQIQPGLMDLAVEGVDAGARGAFEVNKIAHQQIATKIEIPGRYYRRMLAEAPALLAHNVNHWFREQTGPRLVRTLDGRVRAFLSNAYRAIENADLLAGILPPLMEALNGEELRFESGALTDQRMYLKAFLPGREVPIRTARVNDVIRVGFVLGNSEVGCGKVYARPMVMVLSCLNGQQFDSFGQGVRHVGRRIDAGDEVRELYSDEALAADDRALILKTRDVALAALDEAKAAAIAEKIVEAAGSEEISGDVQAAIEEVGSRVGGLSESEQSGILQHLAAGGDLSKWGVSQAVTRHSQDVDDYDRADELERIGGQIIELPGSAWKAVTTAKAA
jgi:hypothetical protein